jgi:carotenoid cleavage dioxygenase
MASTYLAGNFAPVHDELTVTELAVTGTVPEFLDGRYLRNGPNPISEVDPATYHWVFGDGMVHGVRLRDGQAQWYRNRWVRSASVASALGETAPGPRRSARLTALGANTNVIAHAGRTLALVEGGEASYELSEELDTVGEYDFDGTLPGGYTPHPKRDPATGELHAVSYFFGWGNRVQYSVIGTDGRARRTVDIQVTGSPMMHNFSLTEKYVIFYDLPVVFDAEQAVAAAPIPGPLRTPAKLVMSALIGRVRVPDPLHATMDRALPANGRMPYHWDPRYPARVGVMPREGGSEDVRWFQVGPCFVFHPLNAYDLAGETGDTVVLDVVRHPKMFATDRNGPNEGQTTLDRWTIELAAGTLRESRLDDHPQEFPQVDERVTGRRHRYGYTMAAQPGTGLNAGNALLRHDLLTGRTERHTLGAGRQGSEFVFVPSSPHAAEEDGVLMGYVYDTTTDRSDLVILDAQTLDSIATVHLPARVPNGFHGNWLPTSH